MLKMIKDCCSSKKLKVGLNLLEKKIEGLLN